MFLEIKAGCLICFDKTSLANDIEKNCDDLFLNLSHIHQIVIKQCFVRKYIDGEQIEATWQIEFDRFVEEGVLNEMTLFFTDRRDKEFKRITNAIEAITLKGKNMASNHNGDIKNPNTGTKGTNKTYDKNQGNRGKQMNPNQKKESR